MVYNLFSDAIIGLQEVERRQKAMVKTEIYYM